MKTIYDFKKGDEIVRISPAKPYQNTRDLFGNENIGIRDRSYMGEKLIFVGIANGQIYCQRTDSLSKALFGDKLLDLDLALWDDGWEYYVDPTTLMEDIDNIVDDSIIEEQINKAILSEDYELAGKLKKKLKKN